MNFTERFRQYLLDLVKVLRGEESAAKVFANATDNGQCKEGALRDILSYHIPSSCNIFLGGFLFNLAGDESKQLDIIITDSQSLNFNLHNKGGDGKSFACVDGCISVISSKSYLNKNETFEALENVASIPNGTILNDVNSDGRINLSGLNDGPIKVIFALDGVRSDTMASYLHDFYNDNPDIPNNKKPNYIHILGKYTLVRLIRSIPNDEGVMTQIGRYCKREHDADLYFLSSLLTGIEIISRLHRAVFYDYTKIFEVAVPPKK